MDPSEIEFIAERQTVSIIPKFTSNNVLHLISGDVGPFRAGLPVIVPLWVAVHLRQKQKCRIIAPEWMNVNTLLEKKEEEKQSRLFTKMPNEHYMEVAHMVLTVAGNDIQRPDAIRTAVKDLWDLRIAKLRSSMDVFIKSQARTAKLDHLTQLEINSVRPLLPDTLDVIHDLQTDDNQERSYFQTSTFSASQ
ncbi:probable DNA replication complex GINS protein PSF2 [Macrosteles quadrilineatus]|uniref:probable DNA replication complex GINS protein PSF2 n=1 Tax=Macrosteles quadrilineatus TaxID=74068 RepID=UPI0023E1A019|nr:probable DNA replication complex GINS protein PSF2 [Macrosteles quadrilineatus]